jgi:hypothetical protein
MEDTRIMKDTRTKMQGILILLRQAHDWYSSSVAQNKSITRGTSSS